MYNPYATQDAYQQQQSQAGQHNPYQPQQQQSYLGHNQQQPPVGSTFSSSAQYYQAQPQYHQQQQQGHVPQNVGGAGVGLGNAAANQIPNTNAANNPNNFNTFFNDPAAQMGLHFSQSAFNASQQYMQNNFGQYIHSSDIKYYFKVSNSYVLKKLFLILFPYKNKTWTRQYRTSTDVSSPNSQPTEIYATPIEDVNAPDLYIPLMAFMSYILFWALFSGFEGDFHPQLLGNATTKTLACYLCDFVLLKISFYVLGISSKNSKLWDLVSYSGYKFVSVLVMMIIKHLVAGSWLLTWTSYLAVVFSLGFFMMRSLRYVVLPSGLEAGNLSGGAKKIRTQYLFAYCFVIQAAMVWLMA